MELGRPGRQRHRDLDRGISLASAIEQNAVTGSTAAVRPLPKTWEAYFASVLCDDLVGSEQTR